MSRRIILERPVSVSCWRVVGQIAKAGKRAELLPVLLRADEKDGTNAKDLAKHLLFEPRSRRVVAERLLGIATAYGLLEEDGHVFVLTETGKQAIHTAQVFVPEEGAWGIWASDDPTLPSPLLGIEPWNEPTAYQEIIEGKDTEERRYEAPPDWLRAIEGRSVTPASGNNTAVRIDRIEDKAEAVNVNRSLRLRWNVGDRRLQLSGTVEGLQKEQPIDVELEAPDISPERVWRMLIENAGLGEQWDETREVLFVPFDETSDTEREAMSRDLRFKSPSVRDYGKFEPLTIPQVAITAGSKTDAQSWANHRLIARIRDYATSKRYADWCEEAAAPFDLHEIKLPARTHLARVARDLFKGSNRSKSLVWHLVAANDWNL